MLIKLNLISSVFARQRVEKKVTAKPPLTHQQWLMIDRIVMALLFFFAIIGAILFS